MGRRSQERMLGLDKETRINAAIKLKLEKKEARLRLEKEVRSKFLEIMLGIKIKEAKKS